MDRINVFMLEPGAYKDGQGFEVVLLDIVTHGWNADHNLLEALPIPLVVVRDLKRINEHVRYGIPIDVFNKNYSPIR